MIEYHKVGLRDVNKAEYRKGKKNDKMIHVHARTTV